MSDIGPYTQAAFDQEAIERLRAKRDAEVTRLVEALRLARKHWVTDGHVHADVIDALLREYTPKEKRDEQAVE